MDTQRSHPSPPPAGVRSLPRWGRAGAGALPSQATSRAAALARWTGIAAVAWLSACTPTPPQAAASPATVPLRVMVKLAQPASEPAEVERRVGHAAGVPVRHQSAASALWHAVVLSCPASAEPCHQALARLRQDSAIAAVETQTLTLVPQQAPAAASSAP